MSIITDREYVVYDGYSTNSTTYMAFEYQNNMFLVDELIISIIKEIDSTNTQKIWHG